MFVDAVLCSPLGLLTLKARAALGCHISAEVNRQASAAVTHTADESFAESGSIYTNSTIKPTPSALAAVETTLLSQLTAYSPLVHLQLRCNNPKAGENRSSSSPSVFSDPLGKHQTGAVKCFSETPNDIKN